MLLNRVLLNVLWKHSKLIAVCHNSSPLITPLYGPNKVKYSIGCGRQQVTINFASVLRHALGWITFPAAQSKTWCWLLFPQWKGGSQMFLRRDLCQRLTQECRFPGKPKNLSVQPQLLMNWHDHDLTTVIIPWAMAVTVSCQKSTEIVWEFVGEVFFFFS